MQLFATVSHNPYSKGAKALGKLLGARRMTTSQLFEKTYGREEKVNVVNWGISHFGELRSKINFILNNPKSVSLCSNKIFFFDHQTEKHGGRIPEYTKDLDTAMQWIEDGVVVLGRKAKGSSGSDIVFYEDDPDGFMSSEFFTKYKKKKDEFRVHVFRGEVLFSQRKAIRTTDPVTGEPIDTSAIDTKIRNLKNGYVFVKSDVNPPEDVITQSLKAFGVTGLDFGAVDVIYNAYEDKAYVLEINTAPGLEGTSPEVYAEKIKSIL